MDEIQPLQQPESREMQGFMVQHRNSSILDREISGYRHELDSQEKLDKKPVHFTNATNHMKLEDASYVISEQISEFEQPLPLMYPDFSTEYIGGSKSELQLILLKDSARIYLSTHRSHTDDDYQPEKLEESLLQNENNMTVVHNLESGKAKMHFEQEPCEHNLSSADLEKVDDGEEVQHDDKNGIYEQAIEDAYEVNSAYQMQGESYPSSQTFMFKRKIASEYMDQPVLVTLAARSQSPLSQEIVSSYTEHNLKYESSFSKVETIVRHLVQADQESVSEVELAMAKLELQKVNIIRQVVLVQIRRMLSLLEQIKVTQSSLMGSKRTLNDKNDPKTLREMVRTCSEALMIEVVSEEADPPETNIRGCLKREELNKIVYTWAEELCFEQICSQQVLDRIFSDFDVDGDGLVSENDLQTYIYLVTTASPNSAIQQQSKIAEYEALFMHHGEHELVLELESENESAKVTARQVNMKLQFDSIVKASSRSRETGLQTDALLRLKSANSQDLIDVVKEMKQGRENAHKLQNQQASHLNTEQLHYKDFVYVHEKQKIASMVMEYQSNVDSISQPSFDQQQRQSIAQTEHQRYGMKLSFETSPLKHAVHPQDNSSDKEPNQPEISENLKVVLADQKQTRDQSVSQAEKSNNTFRSQDDLEPEQPLIGSEFKSHVQSGNKQDQNFSPIKMTSVIAEINDNNDYIAEPQTVKMKKIKTEFDSRHHGKLYASELQSAGFDMRLDGSTLKEMSGVSAFDNTKTNLYETSFINDLRHENTAEFGHFTKSEKIDEILLLQTQQTVLPINEASQSDQSSIQQEQDQNQNIRITTESVSQYTDEEEEAMDFIEFKQNGTLLLEQQTQQIDRTDTENDDKFQDIDQLTKRKIKLPQGARKQMIGVQTNPASRAMSFEDSKDIETKSRVSFSNSIGGDHWKALKPACSTQAVIKQFYQQKTDEQTSKQSPVQHKSFNNSELLFQSSLHPNLRDTIKKLPQGLNAKVGHVDQGTDPMSQRKQSEKQQHGSHQNSAADERLSNQSVAVSIQSDQLLPIIKFKYKDNGMMDKSAHGRNSTVNESRSQEKEAQQESQNHNSDAKGNNASLTEKRRKSGSSPIPEVDEEKAIEKTQKKKLKRKKIQPKEQRLSSRSPRKGSSRAGKASKEPSSSRSPDELMKAKKVGEKNKMKLVKAHQKQEQNKTFSFENQRKVQFSDMSQMNGSESSIVEAQIYKPDFKNEKSSVMPVKGKLRRKKSMTGTTWYDYKDNLQQTSEQDYIQVSIINNSKKASPSRVFKTNAKNQLQQSAEVPLPKELKKFSKAAKTTKLKPLDKRLDEARMNMLNASFKGSPLHDETSAVKVAENKEPLKSIDWGPDPEPIFSVKSSIVSNLDKSRQRTRQVSLQLSHEANSSLSIHQHQLDSSQENQNADYQPYTNVNRSDLKQIESLIQPQYKKLSSEPRTAHNPLRNRQNKVQTPLTDIGGVLGPFNRESLINSREEHHRTSMVFRRPSNVPTYLYIDETPSQNAESNLPINADLLAREVTPDLQSHNHASLQEHSHHLRTTKEVKPININHKKTKKPRQLQDSNRFGQIVKRSVTDLTKAKIQGPVFKRSKLKAFFEGQIKSQNRSISTLGKISEVDQSGRKHSKDTEYSIGQMDPPRNLLALQVTNESAITTSKNNKFKSLPYLPGREESHKSQENLRTARRSQQTNDFQQKPKEILAVSSTDNKNFKTIDAAPLLTLYSQGRLDSSLLTSNETRVAQISHSIEVVDKEKLLSVSSKDAQWRLNNGPSTFQTLSVSSQNRMSHQQPLFPSQAIRKKAERRYAAYNKKNVMTMFRSINDVQRKKATVLESVYKSARPNENSGSSDQVFMFLPKNESQTLLQGRESGSIEIVEQTEESAANEDYEEPSDMLNILQPRIKIEQVKAAQQLKLLKKSSLPSLSQEKRQFIVVQPHQKKLLSQAKSRLEFPSKDQMRFYLNKDLDSVQDGIRIRSDSSQTEATSKYQIVGTAQKSQSVIRLSNVGGAVPNAVANSASVLSRKPSKQFNLRESGDGIIQIKNMFIHKAVRQSPQGLPMDFDNRYTMEIFKSMQNRSKITPIGIDRIKQLTEII